MCIYCTSIHTLVLLIYEIHIANAEVERLSDTSLLLYIQKRNSVLKAFEAPIQVYFDGVTCSDLEQFISQRFSIPLVSLEMYKYVKHNNTWQLLKEQEVEPVTGGKKATNKRGKDNKPIVKNVRSKPFNLRDGGNIFTF